MSNDKTVLLLDISLNHAPCHEGIGPCAVKLRLFFSQLCFESWQCPSGLYRKALTQTLSARRCATTCAWTLFSAMFAQLFSMTMLHRYLKACKDSPACSQGAKTGQDLHHSRLAVLVPPSCTAQCLACPRSLGAGRARRKALAPMTSSMRVVSTSEGTLNIRTSSQSSTLHVPGSRTLNCMESTAVL